MLVDDLDGTLVCEEEDLQNSLSYFKKDRATPEYIERGILKYIYEAFNLEYYDKLSINQLLENLPRIHMQQMINDINTMFKDSKIVEYKEFHLSYLLYYLSANIFKIWKPLLDLHLKNLLKPELNILDIGTGPGSIPIGIIEFYKSLAINNKGIKFKLKFTLIEAENEFLNISRYMINHIKQYSPNNLEIDVVRFFCHTIEGGYLNKDLSKYDLISMSNFLSVNEKNNHSIAEKIIDIFSKHLYYYGAIIIIEPGDENNCYSLKSMRNKVIKNSQLNIYSPCIPIWEERKEYNCNCFNMARTYWEIPSIFRFLKQNGLNKANRIDIPFNYLVFRKDGHKKYEIEMNHQHFIQLKDIKNHIGNRLNIKARIRSVIENRGSVRILLCDGSCGFYKKENGIYIDTNNEFLKKVGIDVKLISGERLVLNKVMVKKQYNNVKIEMDEISRVKIDY